jgi:hypothetical protein
MLGISGTFAYHYAANPLGAGDLRSQMEGADWEDWCSPCGRLELSQRCGQLAVSAGGDLAVILDGNLGETAELCFGVQ